MALVFTVAIFSIVQSLFGVGLLVFGTPTLLLAGYSFEDTIGSLLPSSLVISSMQILHGRQYIREFGGSLLLYCAPFIVIGLAMVLSDLLIVEVRAFVGVALILSAATRLVGRVRETLTRLLKRYAHLYLMVMGLIHGMTNMGGAFLAVFVSALHNDKEQTRANIAFGYFIFAATQIIVLLVFQTHALSVQSIFVAAIALLVYQTIGNLAFLRSSQSAYQHLITAFMIAYGVLLIGQELL